MESSARIKEIIRPKKKKKKKQRNGTLRAKDYTTPLLQEAEAHTEKPVVTPLPVKKPRMLRIFWLIWKLAALIFWIVVYKLLRGRMSPLEIATKVKDNLGALGGMWIKAGQVISMRSDAFPLDFCNELAKLQDKATRWLFRRYWRQRQIVYRRSLRSLPLSALQSLDPHGKYQ